MNNKVVIKAATKTEPAKVYDTKEVERLVNKYSHYYYGFMAKIPGMELDDLKQLIRMITFEIIKRWYKPGKGSTVETLVRNAIRQRLINELRREMNLKRRVLTEAVSFDGGLLKTESVFGGVVSLDAIVGMVDEDKTRNVRFQEASDALDGDAKTAFRMYISGHEFDNIARQLGRTKDQVTQIFRDQVAPVVQAFV